MGDVVIGTGSVSGALSGMVPEVPITILGRISWGMRFKWCAKRA